MTDKHEPIQDEPIELDAQTVSDLDTANEPKGGQIPIWPEPTENTQCYYCPADPIGPGPGGRRVVE